jgi:chemotaxis protein histidine kinase CheA
LAARDFKQAHSLVHNLKGLAGNLEATDLQVAAMAMEKLVKGQAAETASEKELNRKLTDLESALTQALDAVQSLSPIAEKKTMESTADGMPSVDSELVKKVVDPIKSAAEMGDVMQVKSIAEDLKSKSDAVGPFCDRILRLAEDFEFDSIIKFVLEFDT